MEKYNRIITRHLTSAHEIEIFKIKHKIFLVFRNLSAIQNDFWEEIHFAWRLKVFTLILVERST